MLEAGLAVGEDDGADAGDGHPALAQAAGQQGEIDGLAFEHLGAHGLQLDHDAVPLGLGKGKRVARQVQIDRAVKPAVGKRMVLVRAEIA